ncbi:MAG: hypothetical protein RL719_513 [Actinomycetota bacterium]
MNQIDIWELLWSLLLDLASVVLLSYVFYYRRHHNRDMTVAIATINITLFALGGALASFTLSLGVGFALFAVISIIRLRSDEAGWIEMAYLLVGLSTGLILGLPGFSIVDKTIYASVLVVAMGIIDSKRLFGRTTVRRLSVTLDGVTSTNNADVRARVEELLGTSVDEVTVKSVQSMPAAMKVEVRYREQKK